MKKLYVAGLTATTAMTALMYVAPKMGMPKMDFATMLGTMFVAGPALALWLGMLIHLAIGSVLFPAVYHFAVQPENGSGTDHGLMFGFALWAAANLIVMPMMSTIHPMVRSGMMTAPGVLMLHLGALAPIDSLIGHLLYGALLGKLAGPKAARLQLRTA